MEHESEYDPKLIMWLKKNLKKKSSLNGSWTLTFKTTGHNALPIELI